jgi:signal transduction histidine kinase
MSPSPRRYGREIGVTFLFLLGAGLFLLHVWHAISEQENFMTILFGVFFPALFAVSLMGGAVSMWRAKVEGWHALRVTLWSLFGASVFVIGAVLAILYQREEGVVLSDQMYITVNAASGGAIGGFVMGLYDRRQHIARRETERLNNRLTVLNRVLRHDIRNRANVLKGHASALDQESDSIDKNAAAIRQQADEIVNLGEKANRIETLVQTDDHDREVVDVGALTESVAEQIQDDHPAVEMRISLDDDPPAYAHPLITTAVANVVENAIEHNDADDPRVEVSTATVNQEEGEFVELRIADNGPGIPNNEVLALERGFETDLEHTSGLGLWLVYWIISASDGDIELDTTDANGALITLRLEVATEKEPTMTSPKLENERLVSRQTVD